MAIERLSFSAENQYNAIELAIHLARYSVVQSLCRDLNILDVACGEGYGSYVMASFWGAKFVTGVDISEQAIKIAQKVFAFEKVNYIASSAEKIDELFEENSFDLVISLETIEHVNNPEKFLTAIKKLLKPSGIAVISCPNDHWYYGPGESQNPYHLRTYYFNEFREQAEKYLGEAKCFLFGRPINGFGNFLLEIGNDEDLNKQMVWELNRSTVIDSNCISTDHSVSIDNSSYFIGIWGNLPVKKEELVSATLYPISMDKFSLTLEDVNNSLTSEVVLLKTHLENVESHNKELQTVLINSQNRLSELDKWTLELQTALNNSENYVLELNKWTEDLKSNLSQSNRQKEMYQQEIENQQQEIENQQQEIENQQSELERLSRIIIEMEQSKFWKLRNYWYEFKNFLPTGKKKAS